MKQLVSYTKAARRIVKPKTPINPTNFGTPFIIPLWITKNVNAAMKKVLINVFH